MTNNDIKIIKEAIKERQELLTTCAVLQDELRKEIAEAKKMLEQKKLNNSITVRRIWSILILIFVKLLLPVFNSRHNLSDGFFRCER